MSRVLATPSLAAADRHLATPSWHADAGTRAWLDRVEADAYHRGLADGEAGAITAAAAAGERATAALRPLLDELGAELARLRGDRVQADVGLALAIAERVVGTVPPVEPADLAARVHAAVAELADPDLEARVNVGQVDALSEALAAHGDRHVRVTGDPTVAVGEALVCGRWARAELTRQAAMSAVQDALVPADEVRDV